MVGRGNETPPPFNSSWHWGGRSTTSGSGGGATTLGVIWGWHRPPLNGLQGWPWPPPGYFVGGRPPIMVVDHPIVFKKKFIL
jgi:hypothetical protein